MIFTKFLAASLALVPLTIAATVPTHVANKDGTVSKAPSATKQDVIDGIPCPGLKALAMNKKFDAIIKDWSDPRITLDQATKLFQDTFNLQHDFTKFTIGAASKLSKVADGSVSLLDIRTYDGAKPIPGQIVHEACISRADPTNNANDGILTPRPFDSSTFAKYVGHLNSKEPITVAVQAAARKAEVDVHKGTIGPLAWFNIWAESALLLSVLSTDGTGQGVKLETVKDFFEKGVLPPTPSGPIGMPSLMKLTAELIYEAYKSDLTGLASLLKRFATQGVVNAFKNLGLDYNTIHTEVVRRIGTNALATEINGFFAKFLPK